MKPEAKPSALLPSRFSSLPAARSKAPSMLRSSPVSAPAAMLTVMMSGCSDLSAMPVPRIKTTRAIPCEESSSALCGILLRRSTPADAPHIMSKAFAKLPKSGIEVRKSKKIQAPFCLFTDIYFKYINIYIQYDR